MVVVQAFIDRRLQLLIVHLHAFFSVVVCSVCSIVIGLITEGDDCDED
jgi:hypothetical protein